MEQCGLQLMENWTQENSGSNQKSNVTELFVRAAVCSVRPSRVVFFVLSVVVAKIIVQFRQRKARSAK